MLALAPVMFAGCVVPVGPPASASGGPVARDGSAGPDGRPPDGRAAPIDTQPDAALVVSPLVRIEPPGRTFLGSQVVRLVGGPAGSTIHYTIDGSLPTRASRVYSAPLILSASAVVRAVAEGGPAVDAVGGEGGAGASGRPISAAAFIQVAEDLAGFVSDLPVILLSTHASGALPLVREGPLLAGSITVLDPGSPLASPSPLAGGPALVSRAGLRLRGESSLRFPQKSYSVELWSPGANEDSDSVLLGLPADSDYALVGPGYTDRSLMRNALAYAISNQIGRYASRTRFVEVFVVESGGTLVRSDYRGVYTLAENVKRGPSRVNVAKLEVGDQRDPAVTGGYSLRIDKGSFHFSVGSFPFQFVYPRWEEIGQPGWATQRGYLQGFVTEFLEAVSQSTFRHPRTDKPYTAYIDVPSFVDHNLMTVLFKNVDGLRLSAYFHKNRGGPLVAGPVWDFDRSAGTPYDADYSMVPRAGEAKEWAIGDGTHPLQWGFWARLMADPTFKTAHTRRWTELSRGPFAVENIHRLINRFAAELKDAQARHFERWEELPPTGGGHEGEVKLLKDWFVARIPWVTKELAGPAGSTSAPAP